MHTFNMNENVTVSTVLSRKDTGTDEITGLDRFTASNWIYPINYPVRDYQRNIVAKALFTNTLVTLPTGLGKTFIAAVVMYNFHRWFPGHKVVFMAHSRPLVSQQVEACAQIMGMPSDTLAHLNGSVSVASRKVQWETKRIFFLTPQVFNNDLTSGLVAPESIRLVVIDEAHKALGNQAFCQVVRSLRPFNSMFRVLALSATPGNDIPTVKKVIENLMISHLEIRTEDDVDIKQYLHVKNVQDIVVSLDSKVVDYKNRILKVAEKYLRQLTSANALPASYGSLSSFSLVLKQKQFIGKSTSVPSNQRGLILSNFSVVISLYKAIEELVVHGLRSLHNKLIAIKSEEGSKSNSHQRLAKDKDLLQLLESLEQYIGQDRDIAFNPDVSMARLQDELDAQADAASDGAHAPLVYSHPKFVILEDIVTQHFHEWKEKNESTRVIVFCKSRPCTGEICNFLNRFRPLIKPMVLIGQSQSKGGSESTCRGLKQTAQLEVMKKFREGDYNTLVATCVGEEGLDVGEVDLIVNFDATRNCNTQVQRSGRTGRKRDGKVVNLLTEGKEQQDYATSISKSSSMNKKLAHGLKGLPLVPGCRLIPDAIQPKYQEMYLGRLAAASTSGLKKKQVLDGTNESASSSSSGSLAAVRPKPEKQKKRKMGAPKLSQLSQATQSKYDIRYAMDKAREKSRKTAPADGSEFQSSSASQNPSSFDTNKKMSPKSDATTPLVICLDDSFEEESNHGVSGRKLLEDVMQATDDNTEALNAIDALSMDELVALVSANEDVVRMPERLMNCRERLWHLPVEEPLVLSENSDLEEISLPAPPDPLDNIQEWALYVKDLEEQCGASQKMKDASSPANSGMFADTMSTANPTAKKINSSISSLSEKPLKTPLVPDVVVLSENFRKPTSEIVCPSMPSTSKNICSNFNDNATSMVASSEGQLAGQTKHLREDLMTITQALEVVAVYKKKKETENSLLSCKTDKLVPSKCVASNASESNPLQATSTKGSSEYTKTTCETEKSVVPNNADSIEKWNVKVIPESPEKEDDDVPEEESMSKSRLLIPETEDSLVAPYNSRVSQDDATTTQREFTDVPKDTDKNDGDEIIQSSQSKKKKRKKSLSALNCRIRSPAMSPDASPSLVSCEFVSQRISKVKKSLLFDEPIVKSPPRVVFRSLGIDSDEDLFAECESQRAVQAAEIMVSANEATKDPEVLTQPYAITSQCIMDGVAPLEADQFFDDSAIFRSRQLSPVRNEPNRTTPPQSPRILLDSFDDNSLVRKLHDTHSKMYNSASQDRENQRPSSQTVPLQRKYDCQSPEKSKKAFVYRPSTASLQHKRHRVAPFENKSSKRVQIPIDDFLELSPIEKKKNTPMRSVSMHARNSTPVASTKVDAFDPSNQSTPFSKATLDDDELSDGALEAIRVVEMAALAEANKPPLLNISTDDELSDGTLEAIRAVENYEKSQKVQNLKPSNTVNFSTTSKPTAAGSSRGASRNEEADFRLWSSDEDEWFLSRLKGPTSTKKKFTPSVSSSSCSKSSTTTAHVKPSTSVFHHRPTPSTSQMKATPSTSNLNRGWISTKRALSPSSPCSSPPFAVNPEIPKRPKSPAVLSPLRAPKQSKKRRRKANPFLDDEAALSGSSGSDDENSSGLDEMDSSFIDERLAPTQAPGVDMTAKYLSALKSPRAVAGAFKIPAAPGNMNIDVFSQVVQNDDDYVQDSFCVADATEVCDESLSELELAEMRLRKRGKRRREGRTAQKSPTAPAGHKKRRRVVLLESSSDEEDANRTIQASLSSCPAVENPVPSSSSVAIPPQPMDMVQVSGNRLSVVSAEKPFILIGSRALSSTPDITIDLRAKFQFRVDVRSSPGADYILGWRVGVNRFTLSDWRSGLKANRDDVDSRTEKLVKLFMKPVIIVEDDKTKSLYKHVGFGDRLFLKHLVKRVEDFTRRGIRMFYTKDKAHTAEVIAKLALQECSIGCGVVTCFKDFTPELEERLNFYTKLPTVNYALAMRLCQKFSSIKRMMLVCDSIPEIRVHFSATAEDAKKIHRVLSRSFCKFIWPEAKRGRVS